MSWQWLTIAGTCATLVLTLYNIYRAASEPGKRQKEEIEALQEQVESLEREFKAHQQWVESQISALYLMQDKQAGVNMLLLESQQVQLEQMSATNPENTELKQQAKKLKEYLIKRGGTP